MSENNMVKNSDEIIKISNLSKKHKLLILNSQFETLHASFTNLASKICDTPVSLITFVDHDHIWVKSSKGSINSYDGPRNELFCGAVATRNDFLEIEDINDDILYLDNKFLIDGKKCRFYAGAPIKLPMGEMIGVICVFDYNPRKLTDMQREVMMGLADILSKLYTVEGLTHLNI